jgi:thymidine phosphorylase
VDFTELVLAACADLLALSDLGVDKSEGRKRASAAMQDGSALAMYEHWIRAQGGDPREELLPNATEVHSVVAPRGGYVTRLSAVEIGLAALRLGAGRRTKDDAIDHSVGVRCLKKRGDKIGAGDTLAEVHARDRAAAEQAVTEVLGAYALGDDAPTRRPIVLETIA